MPEGQILPPVGAEVGALVVAGADVGALVVGAEVGALVAGAEVGALVVGADVGALVAGAEVGALVAGAEVGFVVEDVPSVQETVHFTLFPFDTVYVNLYVCPAAIPPELAMVEGRA